MNRQVNFKCCLVPLILILGVFTPVNAKVIYVDGNATGANDGSSWADAYNFLQDALADANESGKPVAIRVAQGVYTPDSNSVVPDGTGDRNATFQLINGVSLMGGYAGFGEPDPNARDTGKYEAILSGDLTGDDHETFANNDENAYHVVTGSGTNATAMLEGLTIVGGNANADASSADSKSNGGGMYNHSGSPTISNCTFKTNMAATFGGGICNETHSSPTLTDCRFTADRSTLHGGGMSNVSDSDPLMTRCTFTENRALMGGAMANFFSSSPTLYRCGFMANVATWKGGAMRNKDWCEPVLTHCIFSTNTVTEPQGIGGAMHNVNWSEPIVTNCTFAGNSASNGNALGCSSFENSEPSTVHVSNSILRDGGDEIWNEDGSIITVTYSNVQLGHRFPWPGQGNIDADPSFKDPGNGDYHLKSQAGRWDANEGRWTRDEVTSPCIDAGDPNSPVGEEPFPNGGIVNMGAYGGTAEASKSYFGEPVCETIVAGDINGDCKVDAADLSIMAYHWLCEQQ
jgi:hypothetical protein